MSLIIFAVILILLWVVVEVVSILFKSTGMDLYKARFQTISILTHTGFTTRESELITQHPVRRKIASFMMVISYLTQITLITVLINVMLSDTNTMLSIGVALIVLLVFLYLLTRSKFLSSRFNKYIERIIERRINRATRRNPISQVMKVDQDYGMYEIVIDENGGLEGLMLRESGLKQRFIQVLKIDKGNHVYNFPGPDTILDVGDKLVVYGKIKSIKDAALKQ